LSSHLIALLCASASHSAECNTILVAYAKQNGIESSVDMATSYCRGQAIKHSPVDEAKIGAALGVVRTVQTKKVDIKMSDRVRGMVSADSVLLQWRFDF